MSVFLNFATRPQISELTAAGKHRRVSQDGSLRFAESLIVNLKLVRVLDDSVYTALHRPPQRNTVCILP
jgi:hypothetical protein